MNCVKFRQVRKVLNSKLIEIWAYRKYTSNSWRRLYTTKHMDILREKRLMKRCRNFELRIKLDQEIDEIEKRLKKINKHIHKTFNENCSYREQIIEFKDVIMICIHSIANTMKRYLDFLSIF